MGSSSRRSFVVERKSFSVEFVKDVVEISEKSMSFQVSVGLEVHLVQWLIKKIKGLTEGEGKLGFVGSRKGTNIDVILNLNKNKGGSYLSLLCFTDSFSRGFKCLCFPMG